MPWLFKIGQESTHLMTDLIRQARQCIDGISQQRERPILLGVRVPGTVETCLRIGLDIETWLKEDLIDRLLTGGGYVAFSTLAEELVNLGHRYEVPVYPCINCPGAYSLGNEFGIEALRGAASNMWWSGADGLYLWNYHYLPTPHITYGQPFPSEYRHLLDIAEPKKLQYLDKVFAVNTQIWEQYARASAWCPLPVVLNGEQHQIQIRIGEDVPSTAGSERLQDITLKLKLTGLNANDLYHIIFNGMNINARGIQLKNCEWVNQKLNPNIIKHGNNELKIAVIQHDTRSSPVLEEVMLHVRYN